MAQPQVTTQQLLAVIGQQQIEILMLRQQVEAMKPPVPLDDGQNSQSTPASEKP